MMISKKNALRPSPEHEWILNRLGEGNVSLVHPTGLPVHFRPDPVPLFAPAMKAFSDVLLMFPVVRVRAG